MADVTSTIVRETTGTRVVLYADGSVRHLHRVDGLGWRVTATRPRWWTRLVYRKAIAQLRKS